MLKPYLNGLCPTYFSNRLYLYLTERCNCDIDSNGIWKDGQEGRGRDESLPRLFLLKSRLMKSSNFQNRGEGEASFVRRY